MKTIPLKSFTLFFAFSTFSPLAILAQHKSFNSKRHTTDTLDKSAINAIQVNGSKTQKSVVFNSPYGNISQTISNKLASKKSVNNQPKAKIYYSAKTGLPSFISMIDSANTGNETHVDKKQSCFDFLNTISHLTKIKDPEHNLDIVNTVSEPNGKTHVRLQQKHNGLKIHGAEVIVHLNANGQGESFNGNQQVIRNTIDTSASIDPTKAIEIAITDLTHKTLVRELNEEEKAMLEYDGPTTEKLIIEGLSNSYLLAYHVTIRPNNAAEWDYFINAKTGDIVKSFKNSCHANGPAATQASDLNNITRTVNSYLSGTTYTLQDASKPMANVLGNTGFILTYDAKNTYGSRFAFSPITSTNNTWTSKTAVSAHYNGGMAYDYYYNTHQRNSIDGNGGNVISVINVADDYGASLENAYWNGKYMSYGNGGTSFKPLAGGNDVAGHELTHGVVQFTANLDYYAQAGAINESMADIFGCMMDSTDWLMGEDVVKTSAFPSGALRSLSDPHNGGTNVFSAGWQPKNMSEYVSGPVLDNFGNRDNEGVHINSGIPNYAYYLFATGINSRYRASKVFYRALSYYLTSSAQFIDLRLAVIQAATDLYGISSAEVTKAALAFDSVGIKTGTATAQTAPLPTNPGKEFLLSTDINPSTKGGIFRSSPIGDNFKALIDKTNYNKPSVTDDGEVCYYVGTDKKIYTINVDPDQPLNKTVFDDSPIWANVAISKDGKRLAAITYDADTSIYVYDFTSDQIAKFKLYNPTFSQGVKSAGPVYADGIEWSYDGETLVYDCFNSIPNSGGSNLEYWDINMIKVWDNTLNDFSTGEVFKLFNNLAEGESIGNPTFSKKSPNILAFDYTDDYTGSYYVVGLDTDKNDLNIIAQNNSLAWPSYNKTDTRVAFTTVDFSGNYEIDYVTLNADKITSDYNPQPLVYDAKWPVYYSVGIRDITTGVEIAQTNASENTIYPNPTNGIVHIDLATQYIGSMLEVYDNFGLKIYSEKVSGTKLTHDFSHLPAGLYTIRIKSETGSNHLKVVKL